MDLTDLLLLKAQDEPVIQDVFLWLPGAVSKQGWGNAAKNRKTYNYAISQLLLWKLRAGMLAAGTSWKRHQECNTYFMAHPFHFTRYSILPCMRKIDGP